MHTQAAPSTPDQQSEDANPMTIPDVDKDVRTTMSTTTTARASKDDADTTDEAGGGGASRSRRRALLALLLLLVLALGAAGYWKLVRSPAEDTAGTSTEQAGEEAADAHEEDLDAGPVVALDPVSINLADGHQADLTEQIEAVYEHEVTDVYYTEFVMQ